MIEWVMLHAKDLIEVGALGAFIFKGNFLMTSINKKLETVPKLETDVNEIKLQLRTNGGTSLKDAVNRIEQTLGDVREDVTILKGRESARMYLDAQPTFECDANGYSTALNKALLDIVGLDIDEAIGYGWMKAVKPIDQDRVQREWESSVRNGREFNSNYTFINQITHKETKVHGRARIERGKEDILFIIGTCNPI
ncbi:PAS domain [uncultured Caudovirales phage]|uniref:PAS domain n=1 Tax=uncultured Caudovirales phage TaxID=2100421 RepID=A0A6J5QVN9_9CAUD|nr:PAS domain [uncultured Caudovirales phage]